MLLLLIIGLVLYGRNLPQAGRTMGRFVAQLKRGFQDFKDQMDRDDSIREVRKTIQDTTREMRNLTSVPRAIADPTSALRELTHEAMHGPVADGGAGAANQAQSPHEPPRGGPREEPREGADELDVPDEPPPPASRPSTSPTSANATSQS